MAGTVAVTVGANEDVTCTFTDTLEVEAPTPTLTLDKVAVGGDAEFAFTLGGTALADTLSGADPAVVIATTAGSFTIAEVLTQVQIDAGWSLTAINCEGNATAEVVNVMTGTVTVTVGADEDVICTFTDTFVEPTPDTVEVSIMKHLCTDVSSVEEFEAVENAGAGGEPGGQGTVSGLVATVLACPTIVFTGDVPTEGAISAGAMDYEFSVIDANGAQLLSVDGTFMQLALCETDVMLDADGDGTIEDDVCLDVSHYSFEVVDGLVVITETDEPDGHHFGTIRFTPGSDDADTLVGTIANVEATGVITLDTTADEDDTVMIHAYNFVNEGTSGGGGAGAGGEGTLGGNPLPNTATSPFPTGSMPAALVALLMLASLGAAGYTVRAEASRRR